MFCDELKKWRKKRELTQAQLGEMVGVTGAYIQQLELGKKTNPSLEVVMKLCNALHIAPFDLDFDFQNDDMYKYLINKSSENYTDSIQNQTKSVIETSGKFAEKELKKFKNNAITGLIYLAKYCSLEDQLLKLSDNEIEILLEEISKSLEYEIYKIKRHNNL